MSDNTFATKRAELQAAQRAAQRARDELALKAVRGEQVDLAAAEQQIAEIGVELDRLAAAEREHAKEIKQAQYLAQLEVVEGHKAKLLALMKKREKAVARAGAAIAELHAALDEVDAISEQGRAETHAGTSTLCGLVPGSFEASVVMGQRVAGYFVGGHVCTPLITLLDEALSRRHALLGHVRFEGHTASHVPLADAAARDTEIVEDQLALWNPEHLGSRVRPNYREEVPTIALPIARPQPIGTNEPDDARWRGTAQPKGA